MNELKFKKLFALARKENAPAAPDGFDARVLAAIRREERAAPVTLWEQLGQLFPRLAVAAVLVMGVCVFADFYFTSSQTTTVTSMLTELSDGTQQNNLLGE